MATGEILGWAALALAAILGGSVVLQFRRLARVERRLRALNAGAGTGADRLSLADLIARQGARLEIAGDEIEKLRMAVVSLGTVVEQSVQCVGLVRFNPFQDTGGDQSFALALLDRRGDGVVVSSLHGRSGTRFYAKPVKGGSSPMSLSDEEEQALKQAMAEVPPLQNMPV